MMAYLNHGNRMAQSSISLAYAFYKDDDICAFVEALKLFFAAFPYDINNQNEKHYQAVLYTLLVPFGADVTAEHHTSRGAHRHHTENAQEHLCH